MSEARGPDAVLRLLRLLGDRLEDFFEGDDLAFETLGERLEAGGFTADEVQAAILTLRGLAGQFGGTAEPALEGTPGKHALRVASAEERESLTPEAWGFLLDLRRRGSLAPEQFERVLDLLTGSGIRPVEVALAREVAARVALEPDPEGGVEQSSHGDLEVAN